MRLKLKSEMLLAIAPLDRGANAPFDKRAIVESIARQLEASAPISLRAPASCAFGSDRGTNAVRTRIRTCGL